MGIFASLEPQPLRIYRTPDVFESLTMWVMLIAVVGCYAWSLFWILRDARSRGKDPSVVGLWGVMLWPIYHVVWMIIRPEKVTAPNSESSSFELARKSSALHEEENIEDFPHFIHDGQSMVQIYSDKDTSKVGLYESLLRDAGIETFLRNWHGSNITEIPIPIMYPAICVFSEQDARDALRILHRFESDELHNLPSWRCAECNEIQDAVFGRCWHCGTEHRSVSDAKLPQHPNQSGDGQ